MTLTEIARQFDYVREAQAQGQNRGLRVEAIQHWSGGQPGDSWCMEFAWLCLDIRDRGQCVVPREQSVQTFREFALQNGWVMPDPQPDDLVLSVNAEDHAHHIGIITDTDPLTSIAGNTSKDGVSSNGDGVYEHEISRDGKLFVRVPA
jgi:hypothetical protein